MASSKNTGVITQIIGPVVDVQFSKNLPDILNALEIETTGKKIILETTLHIGDGKVRTISMGPTEGLFRGQKVTESQFIYPYFALFGS